MAPPVKRRDTYANDGNYITRFKQAMEKEDRLTPDLLAQMLNTAEDLAGLLIKADRQIRGAKKVEDNGESELA